MKGGGCLYGLSYSKQHHNSEVLYKVQTHEIYTYHYLRRELQGDQYAKFQGTLVFIWSPEFYHLTCFIREIGLSKLHKISSRI